MPISVVMPALEMAQETGKLVSWLKREGESVTKGEPLLEIETDKAVMEIEAPADGILAGVKVQAGTDVPVGRTIAWIVAPGEAPPQAEQTVPESGRRMEAANVSAEVSAKPPAAQPRASEIRISPKARRLAKENNLDLNRLQGTGAEGEILVADVLAAAAQSGKETAAPAAHENLSAIARLMAERTTQSWTTVPHFMVMREVDATALNEARAEMKARAEQAQSERLTHSDLLISLVAQVLEKHPSLNASWTGSGIRHNAEVNVALAMAVSDGVVAPVVRNANKMSVSEIAVRRKELVERTKAGRLQPTDLAGGTFTISNLGMYNVDAFTAIITPPQAAILAVARIVDRVVPHDGRPSIRSMVTLTLSSDHRVVDGARAAQFMNDLAEAIREPKQWLR
jgi:pyruvate dehydrogenase E2 component (dihydrolipoamide acetyltransferase)